MLMPLKEIIIENTSLDLVSVEKVSDKAGYATILEAYTAVQSGINLIRSEMVAHPENPLIFSSLQLMKERVDHLDSSVKGALLPIHVFIHLEKEHASVKYDEQEVGEQGIPDLAIRIGLLRLLERTSTELTELMAQESQTTSDI